MALPSAYQRVEYIESSGTQRIDTGIAPDDLKYGLLGKFRITSGGNVLIDLSNTTSTDNQRYGFQFNGFKPQWSGIMYQQRGEENGTLDPSTDYEFSYNYNGNTSFTINGLTKTGIPTGSATLPNWNIFCQNCNGSYQRFFTGRLYRLQIYHNTELLRDFIPVQRKSDGVIGMYDVVNDVFYTNAGTGTFTIGPKINESNRSPHLVNKIFMWKLDSLDSDMRGPCPKGFHIPVDRGEFKNIYDAGITLGAWTSSGGAEFSTYLKLPLAQCLWYNGNPGHSATPVRGYYCTCKAHNSYAGYAYNYMFTVDNINTFNYGETQRYEGWSIRPFKDTPVVPDSSWTTLYDGSGVATGAGIFWNSTLGLISISGDGNTWYTIADKNLGATTVYNYGDTKSSDNCGGYFQWGNNYMFPYTGATKTSSEQLDASGYGPWNYYSSDTYMTNKEWDSSNNKNLWGGVSKGTHMSPDSEKQIRPSSGVIYNFESFDANDWTILSRNGYNYGYFQNGYFYSYGNQSGYNGGCAYTTINDDISNFNIITLEAVRRVGTMQTWSRPCQILLGKQQPAMSGSNPDFGSYGVYDKIPMQTASGYNKGGLSFAVSNEEYVVETDTNSFSSNTDYTTKAIFNLNTKTAEWYINGTLKGSGTIPDANITTFRNGGYYYISLLGGDYSVFKSLKLTLE